MFGSFTSRNLRALSFRHCVLLLFRCIPSHPVQHRAGYNSKAAHKMSQRQGRRSTGPAPLPQQTSQERRDQGFVEQQKFDDCKSSSKHFPHSLSNKYTVEKSGEGIENKIKISFCTPASHFACRAPLIKLCPTETMWSAKRSSRHFRMKYLSFKMNC